MEVQNELLKKFRSLHNDPTYKEVSSLTGIQMTRVFRIFNGMEMKLSEYLIIKSLIDEKINSQNNLDKIFEDCKMKLSDNSLKEIQEFCQKKIFVNELVLNRSQLEVA
jgi:hypothetical protein